MGRRSPDSSLRATGDRRPKTEDRSPAKLYWPDAPFVLRQRAGSRRPHLNGSPPRCAGGDAGGEATRRGKLRPNSVDSLTGENSGNNLGPGTPIVHFDQWENDDEIEVK